MMGAKMFTFFVFLFITCTFLSALMERENAFAVTTLTADIDESATTITVVSTADFLDCDDVYVESEMVRYASIDDTHFLGVTRGLEGTNAVAHLEEAKVKNDPANVVNSLLGYNVAATAGTFGTFTAMIGLGWNLLKAVPMLISWNYSFLEGQLVYLKYFLLWPISIGFIFGLTMMFITATMGIFRR